MEPALKLLTGSVPFRMCLFFALNPDESLSTGDVASKYDVEFGSVPSTLANVSKSGWLSKKVPRAQARCRGEQATYGAGPELLKMLGRE